MEMLSPTSSAAKEVTNGRDESHTNTYTFPNGYPTANKLANALSLRFGSWHRSKDLVGGTRHPAAALAKLLADEFFLLTQRDQNIGAIEYLIVLTHRRCPPLLRLLCQ